MRLIGERKERYREKDQGGEREKDKSGAAGGWEERREVRV